MAVADINRLMDNLRIRLPGALDDVLRMEAFNALNDFFQDSNIWYEDIDFLTITDTQNYLLTPSSPASIVRLMGVVDQNEQPISGFMDTLGELVLQDKPIGGYTYTARVSLTVNDPLDREGYPVFPMWVLNKYQNDIIDGVLGRMMSQAAKPYSNPQLAIFHTRKFSAAIAFARVEANRHNIYRGQRWQFPQGFSRRKASR